MTEASPASVYDSHFYQRRGTGPYRSAAKVLPLLWAFYQPRDVVDVGCGTGSWLKAVAELGVSDYLGVEGPWLTRELAIVPFERIQHCDLRAPLDLGRTFELAMSLEVAEHLPESSARAFVASLTRLAPVVLFSAAGIRQGGSQHLNEQWPAYWAALFSEHGFTSIDSLRRAVWNDAEVDWWYAQNTMVYVRRTFLAQSPVLQSWKESSATPSDALPLALVHPRRLMAEPSVKHLLLQLPNALKQTIRRRLAKSGPS